MKDNEVLGKSLGMADCHTIQAKKFTFDRSKKVDRAIADGVWDILQGNVDPAKIAEPDADGMVSVPIEYVQAVAWWIIKRLKTMGCRKGFSVMVLEDEPIVVIEFVKEFEGVLNAEGDVLKTKKEQLTNCGLAFQREMDPERVGNDAANEFVHHLSENL
jgi:hypothetical protein